MVLIAARQSATVLLRMVLGLMANINRDKTLPISPDYDMLVNFVKLELQASRKAGSSA